MPTDVSKLDDTPPRSPEKMPLPVAERQSHIRPEWNWSRSWVFGNNALTITPTKCGTFFLGCASASPTACPRGLSFRPGGYRFGPVVDRWASNGGAVPC